MTRSRLFDLVRLAAVLACAVAPAHAQCPQPTDVFQLPGTPYVGPAIATFDAGAGAQVYAAGPRFGESEVVRWTGAHWERVFFGSDPAFRGFRVLAPATLAGTPVLLAAESGASSSATRIWTFDGQTWTAVGDVAATVTDLGVLDDGTGAAITLCGRSSGPPASETGWVSRWNGTAFAPVGGTLAQPAWAITSFDEGSGPRLHVICGRTTFPVTPGFAARWDGASWTQTGTFTNRPTCLRTFDAGSGDLLYAGVLSAMSGSKLQRWDGASWSPVGAITGSVFALEVGDFGSGPRLVVAGQSQLATSPPLQGLALFDGTSFTSAGAGFDTSSASVFDLAFVDEGVSRKAWVSGGIETAGGLACTGFAAWDGTQWSVLPGAGLFVDEFTPATVRALAAWDGGSVPVLVASGNMRYAGGLGSAVSQLGWDGSAWSRLIPGFGAGPNVFTLRTLTLPWGRALYAGGAGLLFQTLNGIARFDGVAWSSLGWGLWGDVHALEVFDLGAGQRLVAGGNFDVPGTAPGNFVMQYDGANWSAIGTGMNDIVAALAVYDGVTGPQLYAAGSFTLASGAPAAHIARWNGATWSDVGGGFDAGANALCTFDDGGGARLYAGGTFTSAGGAPVSYLARWDGSAWSDVPGGGANGAVLALHVHDDGRGPALYAGGGFANIGGIPSANVARFDGASWETLGGGTDGVVLSITSFDDNGDGHPELFLGGSFRNAFGVGAGSVARLAGCPRYAGFCAGDGAFVDHTTPCPCGNNGAVGHGCANSFVPAGAVLAASGSTFADDVTLSVNDTPQSSFAIYLQHDAQDDRTFHDGVLCAGGHLIRLRNRFSVGGQSSFPDTTFAQDATLTLSQRGQVTPGSGATRYYSLFYRNASSTFCPPALANVSNGVRVSW